MKRYVIPAVLFLAAVVFLLAMWTGRPPDTVRPGTDSYMEGVSVTARKAGRELWRIASERAEISESGGIVRMNGVKAFFPDEALLLEADSGAYDIRENTLNLSKDIRAEVGGYTIRADSLNILPEGERLSVEGRVEIKGRGMRIQGTGLKAYGGQRLEILGNVRAVFL